EIGKGFLGLHPPTLHAVHLVLVGNRGLLVCSPVLAVAAAGLVLLWRRGRQAEAAVAGLVTVLFLLFDLGYFAPYGGDSAAPRCWPAPRSWRSRWPSAARARTRR